MVKNQPANVGDEGDRSLVLGLHSCLGSPRQRSLEGYGLWGRKESVMTEQLSMRAHTHRRALLTGKIFDSDYALKKNQIKAVPSLRRTS